MTSASILMSSDAEMWIIDHITELTAVPDFAGLWPTLCFASNYTVRNATYSVVEHFDKGFFRLGWHHPRECLEHDFREVTISHVRIYVPQYTLDKLDGKLLCLDEVCVGYPEPASRTQYLLRTRAKE